MDAPPLYDLLLALFQDDFELRRFLAVIDLEDVEHRLFSGEGGSLRSVVLDVTNALEDLGLANESLFHALAQRAGTRAADVWAVAELYGVFPPGAAPAPQVGPGDGPPQVEAMTPDGEEAAPDGPVDDGGGFDVIVTPAGGAEPDLYADFEAELEAELSKAGPVDTVRAALDASRWPWTAAAAVLNSFQPSSLRPLPTEPASPEPAITALSAAVYTTFDGRWALTDAVRSAALSRLHAERSLRAAVEANAETADPVRDWLRRLVEGERPKLARLRSSDLDALDLAARWLQPLGLGSQVPRAVLYAVIERRRLIDPLRALVGTHFRGRAAQLRQIEQHIGGDGGTSVMLLWGPGGVGKSTLVGKVLLELEDTIGVRPMPFAYVDFDKRHNDPNNPFGLLEQIVRQLRLLYAATAEGGRDLAGLEAVIAGTDVSYVGEFLNLDAEVDRLDLDSLVFLLAERLRSLTARGDDTSSTPLLLVLDTFEEVQVQGPGQVDAVLGLLRRILEALPEARVIVSGRGEVDLTAGLGPAKRASEIELGDLDREAASALLEHLGVGDPATQTLIFELFGGSPLTLRLAAEALQRMGSAEEAFKDMLNRAHALAGVAAEQVQGQLYSRILGHIGDPEIVRLAHPGLAVRRVNVDVIREVLAEPCGIDPADAASVFERLRREVSLFHPADDGSLRHRPDVRRLMLRAMADEPSHSAQVQEIHRRAAEYYAGDDSPVARGEELYHRLMSDDDPRTLTSLWTPDLRGSLSSALDEPLPPRARQWLLRRLGRDAGDDRHLLDQGEWELGAAERAGSWLASGQPARALEVLGERSERAPGSRLHVLEVTALLDLGRLDDARRALDAGMGSALDAGDRSLQLSLAELAVRLAETRGDTAGVVAASRAVARLADLTGDGRRTIGLLCRSTAALRRVGATAEADALASEVARRFGELPAPVLRDGPELVRDVLRTAGPTESTVLARAAVEVGDTLRDRVFRDDAFALTRLLDQTSPAGRPAMDRLAAEVGLTGRSWTTADLARSLSRSGRVGQAVLFGLDFAVDETTARRLVVDELIRPMAVTGGN